MNGLVWCRIWLKWTSYMVSPKTCRMPIGKPWQTYTVICKYPKRMPVSAFVADGFAYPVKPTALKPYCSQGWRNARWIYGRSFCLQKGPSRGWKTGSICPQNISRTRMVIPWIPIPPWDVSLVISVINNCFCAHSYPHLDSFKIGSYAILEEFSRVGYAW